MQKSKTFWVEIRGSLSHLRCLACWVVEFDYKCPFDTGWYGNRNDYSRYFIGVRVRLIEVSA